MKSNNNCLSVWCTCAPKQFTPVPFLEVLSPTGYDWRAALCGFRHRFAPLLFCPLTADTVSAFFNLFQSSNIPTIQTGTGG